MKIDNHKVNEALETLNSLIESGSNDQNHKASNLLNFADKLRDFVICKIIKIAEEMNSIWEKVNKEPKADGFRYLGDNGYGFFIMEDWHGSDIGRCYIPYHYLFNLNWKEEYHTKCIKECETRKFEETEGKKQKELKLLAELKAKYENIQ